MKSSNQVSDEETANLIQLKKNAEAAAECRSFQTKINKGINVCESQLAQMKLTNALHVKEYQSICDQNNKLQEKISALENDHILNSEKVNTLASRLEDSNSQCKKLEEIKHELSEKAEKLKNENDENKKIIELSLLKEQTLKDQVFALEEQTSATVSELNKATQELELRSVEIEKMSLLIQELQTSISETEMIQERNKVDNANKIIEMNCVIEAKTATINQLLSESKKDSNSRKKLENSIEKIKKVMEDDKNAFTKKVEQLETAVKERESKLSQQTSITLETRKEKNQWQALFNRLKHDAQTLEKEQARRSAPAAGGMESKDLASDGAPPKRKVAKASKTVAKDQLYNLSSESDWEMADIRFITKIWHPNVSSVTGAICLDILKDQWAAALTLRTVLLSIQVLLSAAEPNDPQDAVVAKQYLENQHLFNVTARHWTNIYAGGPSVLFDCNQKIQVLLDMGINEDQARVALSTYDWNLERATEQIFS